MFVIFVTLSSMHVIQKRLLQLSKVRDLSSLSIREVGRQIADDTGKSVHPQLVKYHLEKLINSGELGTNMKPVGRLGNAGVGNGELGLISIPILGSASCGPATIYADEEVKGHVRISPTLLHSKNYQCLYALLASGDSMNNAQVQGEPINNGDYVIVDQSRKTPRNQEYVVFLDDDKANVKKLLLDHANEQVILTSESTEEYDPIFIDPQDKWDSLIQGTVVQVVKKPLTA